MIFRGALIALFMAAGAVPAALAQSTPEATMARFIALANTGKLTTPEGQAILTGEAKEMATDAASNLPTADLVLPAGPDAAAARIVLRGRSGEEADAYFYLEKSPAGWAVSAYRAMAMSGMTMMMLQEMKKRPDLPPADQLLKRNLELVLSTDSQLRAWFAANRPALEDIARAWSGQPAPRTMAQATDPAGVGSSLPALGLTNVSDLEDGVKISIGGMIDNTVGFLRAGPSGPPQISPSEFIWVEDLGGGWFLFRTT